MRSGRLAVLLLAVGCGDVSVCDARASARRLAGGPDAVDCGSPSPYEDQGPVAHELSLDCMIDAFEAGVPFYGLWLDECQLDVCFYEGRAYDGARMVRIGQSILDGAPLETDEVRVVPCEPSVRVRQVSTPAGEVIRRELACEAPDDDAADYVLDDCPTVDWDPPEP